MQFIEDVLRMYCQLDSHTCTHTAANTRAINIHKNARHTYIHISGAYLGLTANIQVGAICNILTMSQTNSILDACDSPRYEPVYLAAKYITKKKKKQTPPLPSSLPLLHLDNMYSDFKSHMLYCGR